MGILLYEMLVGARHAVIMLLVLEICVCCLPDLARPALTIRLYVVLMCGPVLPCLNVVSSRVATIHGRKPYAALQEDSESQAGLSKGHAAVSASVHPATSAT